MNPVGKRSGNVLQAAHARLAEAEACRQAGKLDRAPGYLLDELGVAAGVISGAEYELLNDARDARDEVIAVDAFDPETYKTLH